MSTATDTSVEVVAEAGIELAVRMGSTMEVAGMELDTYEDDHDFDETVTPEDMESAVPSASSLSGRMITLRHKMEDMNENCRKHHRLIWNWCCWTTLILLYGLFGGLIFRVCEHSNERRLIDRKKEISDNIEWLVSLNTTIAEIGPMLEGNVSALYDLSGVPDKHAENRWRFVESVVFAFTTCSTIGYGYTSPSTSLGKSMVVFYGLPGIILYCVAFYGVGRVILDGSTLLIRKMIRGVRRLEGSIAHKVKQTETECDDYMYEICCFWLPKHKHQDKSKKKSERTVICCHYFELRLITVANIQRTVIGFLILFLVLLIGAIDLVYSQEWSFSDAIYFMFVSISTIGFGDLQPKNRGPRALFRIVVVYSGLSVLAALLSQWQDNVQKELASIIDRSEMAMMKLKTQVSQSHPMLRPKLSLTGKSSTNG